MLQLAYVVFLWVLRARCDLPALEEVPFISVDVDFAQSCFQNKNKF
jgi:hypothetical protein